MEGQGWIDISGEKSYWWWLVACRIIVSAPVPFPFLWTLDFLLGFLTWIFDLDLGLGFGTGLGPDKNPELSFVSVSEWPVI